MSMTEPNERTPWESLEEVFAALLESREPDQYLASISDRDLREAAERLWLQHLAAEEEGFLQKQTALGPPPVFARGQRLCNRFVIIRQLGAGGMGEVYLASDEKL